MLRRQLNPGEIIVFEDKLFKHGATPLEGPSHGSAMRDVLVCTVDYRKSYLGPRARLRSLRRRIRNGSAIAPQRDTAELLRPAA